MYSESKTYLFIWILLFGLVDCYSQQNQPLELLSQKQQSIDKASALRVLKFAKEKSIPVSLNTTEGQHFLLVDVENGIPVYLSGLNSDAALTTGASRIQGGMSGLNIEGEGILIGVWDEGSVIDHVELGTRVISKEANDSKTHASHVTGTIIASGVNPLAKGMAPKATVTNWYFNNDLAEMSALARPDKTSLLLSNHSYGTVTGWTRINSEWVWTGNPAISTDEDYRFGFYGSKAQALDQLANLAPYYSIVWAAGNDRGEPGDGSRPPDCNSGSGYDCIIPESVAKNIITVGAINKTTMYTGPPSVVMSTFSSWGPTDDGRIKPDLVAAGVNLFSLSADGVNTYSFSSGTSMATPNVTGSLALLLDLYGKLHGGDVMKATTLKALAIHTAKEAGPLPGPDYSFGWGLLDVEAASKILIGNDGVNTMVMEHQLKNGEQFEVILHPKANQKITATLVWNDPAAQPVSPGLDPINLMLVNDLDVKLISENNVIHYPWLLDPSTPTAQAIKGDNYRDNVEKLEFNLPEAKPYRLVVSHKGQLPAGGQDFSLILNYQATQSNGKTLYWVGDSGDWGDVMHWSLTSGGVPASAIPDPEDRIIVDENSFDGVGLDEIRLNQNRSCATVKWLRSSQAKLNFQGQTLTVGKEFTVGSNSFGTTGTGSIRCSASPSSKGNLFFTNVDLGSVQLILDGGDWAVVGNLQSPYVELKQGSLSVSDATWKIDKWMANSSNTKSINLNHSVIEVNEQSDMDGNNLKIVSHDSKIKFHNTTAVLNWSNVSFNGLIDIVNSEVSINGNNSFDELSIEHGSSLILQGSTNQQIKRILMLEGDASSSLSISSASKATITVSDHFLICTDFLNITNVDLIGSARINAGTNSNLINSSNWLTQSCETVLFADFEEKYLCQNGFTEFSSKSIGATQWEWNFGDESSAVNFSSLQNSFHGYEASGMFNVTLTVGDGQSTHSFSRQIEIKPTTNEKNKIAVQEDELMSLSTSASYQWFLNEQKIDQANSRSYGYDGKDGLYRVVINDDKDCNISSDLVTITALKGEQEKIEVYPNPVNDFLNIETSKSEPVLMMIKDLLGRLMILSEIKGEMNISTRQLPDGVYVLLLKKENVETYRKIVVKH